MQEHSVFVERIVVFVEEYLQGYLSQFWQKQKPQRVVVEKWRSPNVNFVKINFDGELFGEFDEAGLVVVIRNSERGEGGYGCSLRENHETTSCGDCGVVGSSSCSGFLS